VAGLTTFWTIDDSSSETTATGPMAISRDVPMTA
jgi:hypothetical protein